MREIGLCPAFTYICTHAGTSSATRRCTTKGMIVEFFKIVGRVVVCFGEENENRWMIQNKGSLSEKRSAAEKPLKCVSESALCGVNELTPSSLSFF